MLFGGAQDILQEFKMYLPTRPNKTRPKPDISTSEAVFFDSVKQYIGNQQTYFQFLRVLNLFTQQQIDANGLVDQCESYLGGNAALYNQLKLLVGYDEKDRVIENIPDKTDCGPSYRSVPISVSLPP
jgi:paired amphipathic helix protein Sin3a